MLDLNETLMVCQQASFAPLSFEDSSEERGLVFCLPVKEIRKWTQLCLFSKLSPFIIQTDLSQLLWCVHEMNSERFNMTCYLLWIVLHVGLIFILSCYKNAQGRDGQVAKACEDAAPTCNSAVLSAYKMRCRHTRQW